MEYIRADDVKDIIYSIKHNPSEYYGYSVGIAEQMVLDRDNEIAKMLKDLEIIELEDNNEN